VNPPGLRRGARPEHGRKASIGRAVFHLAGRQPVDIEFGIQAGAAAPRRTRLSPDLNAVTRCLPA
jgi:hypothetical protein